MRRYTITLGAATTCGGKVVTATAGSDINGVPIALEGDLVSCPVCGATGKIMCVGPRIPETLNGKHVALENDFGAPAGACRRRACWPTRYRAARC